MRFLFLFLSFISWSAVAHQTSLTSSGKELVWSNPNIPVAIKTNSSDLSASLISSIIQNSMAEWNASSSAKVNPSGSSSNEIKFVSNFPYGSAVIGVTELSFNTSGTIQKASILLNDDYYFHSSPGLYPAGQVFLGDVVTHELGHLFGLSHSEVLNSTMFYSSFSGQSSVSLDDKSGIRQKYDTVFGSISGYVKGGNSVGVLGAHVQAISRNTGEASGAVSDEHGYFVLGGLDLNDTYYLYTSPVKNPDSLPGYFSNTQDKFCPASYVGSFYSTCGRENDGKPVGLNLTYTNPDIDVGTVTINCSLKADPAYDAEKLKSSFSALTIYDYGLEGKSEKSFVGWFRKPSNSDWSSDDKFLVNLSDYGNLSGTSKYIKVSLVSYPLGTQLEYQMSLKHNGSLVTTQSMSYSNVTETYQPDLNFYQPLNSNPLYNNFEISLKSRKLGSSLSSQTFPSYQQFSNEEYLPYLLVVSLYEMTPSGLKAVVDTTPYLSGNDFCLDAPFTFAVAQARVAGEESTTQQDQVAAAAGCGTIEPPGGSGPGSSLPLMVTGFLLALLASSVTKSRKKFLS